MNDFEIVKLGINDYNNLVVFLKEIDRIFPVPMSVRVNIETHAKKLLDLGAAFIAQVDNKYVGVLLGYANDYEKKRGYLATLGIKEEYRNFGIGAKLIKVFADYCLEKNMNYIGLHAHRDNKRAIKFYQNNGFILTFDDNKPYIESVYLTKKIK